MLILLNFNKEKAESPWAFRLCHYMNMDVCFYTMFTTNDINGKKENKLEANV